MKSLFSQVMIKYVRLVSFCKYSRPYSSITGKMEFKEIEIPMPWGKVAGKDWGDPSSEPWLAIHGWLDNAGSFDLLAKDWPAGHRIVSIDFPGHGFSSHLPPGCSYHYLDGSTLVERISRILGWDKFNLIGHSMGAGIASVYAALYPEKVKSLIMIDLVRPVARSTESFLPKTRSAIDDLLRLEAKFPNFHGKVYPTREDAHERLLDGIAELGRATNGGEDSNHGITEKGVQIIMQRGIQKSECGTGWVFSRDLRHRVGSLYGLYNHNLEQVATNIHCKHLLIKASLSPNYEEDESISRTIDCYSKNPLFVNRVVEGNHHLHLNNPENVLPVIKEFILSNSNL